MRTINIFVYLILSTLLMLPHTNALGQGESGGAFLLIAPGARAGGMGEAQVAVANDAYATYWNPAGLGFLSGGELAAMHMNWLPGVADDIYYEFLALRKSLGTLGTLGLQGTYLSLGEIVHTGEGGPETLNTYASYMWNLGLSYSKQVSPYLSAGITLKYYRQFLAPSHVMEKANDAMSSSFAFDIGLLYRQLWSGRVSLGMAVSNIGPAIKFYDPGQADPAPTRFLTGINLGIIRHHSVSLDLAYDISRVLASRDSEGQSLPFYQSLLQGLQNDAGQQSWDQMLHNFGGELWFFRTLALRAGGFYQMSGALTSASGKPIPTAGVGLRLGNMGFDFSYIISDNQHPLANTMRFSLNVQFR